jgi:hypothetical protein
LWLHKKVISFVAVFGSGIRDPGWVKIRIRDKHPGSVKMIRILIFFYEDADPDPTFRPDADRDPDPDPSFQIKTQTFEKVLNRLIFHTFWLVICKVMRIRMRIWIRIRIHNTGEEYLENNI